MGVPPNPSDADRLGAALARAQRDLEQLSFSVSHDLRAPLRAIEGYAAILQEDHAAALDAEGQRLLASIGANTRKLSDQIAAILEYSRAVRKEMQPVELDMAALFREVWDEVKPPGRDLRFELAPLPSARGDRAAVRAVVGKLLNNGLKFTSQRENPQIQVSACTEAAGPGYEVADNGAGFDPQYADKLFGLFARLHTVDEFPGLGAGLAVARLLLERQGGWIRGQGQPDGGARFRFGLPDGGGDAG